MQAELDRRRREETLQSADAIGQLTEQSSCANGIGYCSFVLIFPIVKQSVEKADVLTPLIGRRLTESLVVGKATVDSFKRGYAEGRADAEARDWNAVELEIFGADALARTASSNERFDLSSTPTPTPTPTTTLKSVPTPTSTTTTPTAMPTTSTQQPTNWKQQALIEELLERVDKQETLLGKQQAQLWQLSQQRGDKAASLASSLAAATAQSTTDDSTATPPTTKKPQVHTFDGITFIPPASE